MASSAPFDVTTGSDDKHRGGCDYVSSVREAAVRAARSMQLNATSVRLGASVARGMLLALAPRGPPCLKSRPTCCHSVSSGELRIACSGARRVHCYAHSRHRLRWLSPRQVPRAAAARQRRQRRLLRGLSRRWAVARNWTATSVVPNTLPQRPLHRAMSRVWLTGRRATQASPR